MVQNGAVADGGITVPRSEVRTILDGGLGSGEAVIAIAGVAYVVSEELGHIRLFSRAGVTCSSTGEAKPSRFNASLVLLPRPKLEKASLAKAKRLTGGEES